MNVVLVAEWLNGSRWRLIYLPSGSVCIEWDSVMCMCDVVSCGVVHVISSPMQCAFLLVYIYDFEHTLTKKSSVNII